MSTRQIPTIRQQMFGDIKKKLNSLRAQMNKDVREKCFEALERAKIRGGGS